MGTTIMKKTFYFALIALSAMMISCKGNIEQKDEAPVQESRVDGKKVATELAQYGYENADPMALLQAADMLIAAPMEDREVAPAEVADKDMADNQYKVEKGEGAEGEKAEKAEITPEKLIADAKVLAAEDEAILARAAKIEEKLAAAAGATRGALNGPYQHYDRIYGNTSDTYTIRFRGGELAEVGIVGDGDTDLDLYIYDENGNSIVYDNSYSGNCYVSFYPRWTGPFRVKVINRGGVYNNYCLLTN